MTEEVPLELAENVAAFGGDDAVATFSFYRLFDEEEYLFSKYYRRGESVLDLACGMGRTTLLLYEKGIVVRGVDSSASMIKTAKCRMPYLDLQIGSYDHIEEPDNSYSHVLISFNGIDYAFPVSQRLKALEECKRVLKPGGTFIYSSHNLKSMQWFSPYYENRLRWKLRNVFNAFKSWAYIKEDGVYAFYAHPRIVLEQTKKLGLRLVEMRWFSFYGLKSVDRYFSPYIYYVFEKPACDQGHCD